MDALDEYEENQIDQNQHMSDEMSLYAEEDTRRRLYNDIPSDSPLSYAAEHETNKFDGLCDGAINSVALVNTAMEELLSLKDKLLQHALPPNTLLQIALVSSHLYRSVSDMTIPIYELVRLARLYSQPWEAKSIQLKKLHTDYESKKNQLSIAIDRLQLVDAHSKRITKEKRIMNWERVFSKLTVMRGHGRRWKFLIQAFKNKASESIESLHEYIDRMERLNDVSDDEMSSHHTDPPSRPFTSKSGSKLVDGDVTSNKSDRLTDASDEDEDEQADNDILDDSSSQNESPLGEDKDEGDDDCQSDDKIEAVNQTSVDAEASTQDAAYERYLCVRVFKPEGLEESKMICKLSLGQQRFTTPTLDFMSSEGTVIHNLPDNKPQVLAINRLRKPKDKEPAKQPETKILYDKFAECVFESDEPCAASITQATRSEDCGVLRLSVNRSVAAEPLVAMATIEMDAIENMKLITINSSVLPENSKSSKSCKENAEKLNENEIDSNDCTSNNNIGDSCTEVVAPVSTLERPHSEFTPTETGFTEQDKVVLSKPVEFPLFPINTGISTEANTESIGNLPLVMYWIKKPIPLAYHRSTESFTVRDIVLEATGFDLNLVTKEELHKQTTDSYVSPMTPAPPPPPTPKPEMVLKSEFDALKTHQEEQIMAIQVNYEKRLQELADTLDEMRSAPPVQIVQEVPAQAAQPGITRSTLTSPSWIQPRVQMTASSSPPPTQQQSQQQPPSLKSCKPAPRPKSVEIYKTADPLLQESRKEPEPLVKIEPKKPVKGQHQATNDSRTNEFLMKLKQYEEESARTRRHLVETSSKRVSDLIERKLAGEYKLDRTNHDITEQNMKDVSLPAVFMPSKGANINIFNPRAHDYFHATGAGNVRLTQPPTMIQLPPLPKNQIPILNLFELSKNFNDPNTDWLLERYLNASHGQYGGAIGSGGGILQNGGFSSELTTAREKTPLKSNRSRSRCSSGKINKTTVEISEDI